MLTTDKNDPELTHGVDETPVPQAKKYLILSEEERAKGFVRPVRRTYIHVGLGGTEADPDSMLGCGVATTMGDALAETYARNPNFYGATYCVGCQKHLPVSHFVWEDKEVVGS